MEVRRSPSSRSTQQRELLASWHGFFRPRPPRPPADAEQECKTRSTIDEVLLANLMQRMEDRGEVFEHVAEYCVYLVLVYERTDGSRALVGAYVGSAGRRGQSYLCAYEHRAAGRNRSILNHAGKGDSNLSVFLASKKAAIASGTPQARSQRTPSTSKCSSPASTRQPMRCPRPWAANIAWASGLSCAGSLGSGITPCA